MKRIILLSDGTGNAASSFWRTNVWRTFESINLVSSDQVALYDDGVGTSAFKPLALLGGAFGWGLKRNLIHLYKFLCRNYQPSSEIFAFGFSRGAFTIRLLIALVAEQGLVPYENESDLNRRALAAYRSYRRDQFHSIFRVEVLFRWMRDAAVSIKDRLADRKRYDKSDNIEVHSIRFIGLWDTVAAYGTPIEEMTRGISQWVWPLELPGRNLSKKVQRACHALALDDERTTFHPVLWNEGDETPSSADPASIRNIKDERISQVWFVGMHSNVGGGYPDDALAFIPLSWIMKEAQVCGLEFKRAPQADPDSIRQVASAQDKDGRLYDSRQGLGGYYRYGPRSVHDLCHMVFSQRKGDEVQIDRPKIHETVFMRVQNGAHAYAPINLPARYAVVSDDGTILEQGDNAYESEGQAMDRFLRQENVWNFVWWRRVVYFLTLLASFHLVIFPLIYRTIPSAEFSNAFRMVSEFVRQVGAFLPHFVTVWWLDVYATNPRSFLVGVLTVAFLVWLGVLLGQRIEDEMLCVWKGSKGPESRLISVLNSGIYKIRTNEIYRAALRAAKRHIVPLLFACASLYIGFAVIDKVLFNIRDAAGSFCHQSENAIEVGKTPVRRTFNTDSLCWASGLKLKRNVHYLITVTRQEPWSDGGNKSDLSGLEIADLPNWRSRATLFLAVPMRRIWLRPWSRIVARIGHVGTAEYFLDPPPPEPQVKKPEMCRLVMSIRPDRSGELFLYVNDAVFGIPGLETSFYRNNKGSALIDIVERNQILYTADECPLQKQAPGADKSARLVAAP